MKKSVIFAIVLAAILIQPAGAVDTCYWPGQHLASGPVIIIACVHVEAECPFWVSGISETEILIRCRVDDVGWIETLIPAIGLSPPEQAPEFRAVHYFLPMILVRGSHE